MSGEAGRLQSSPNSLLRHGLYRLHQRAWSAWARRRFRAEIDGVGAFCLFVGYPRSGHSLVGALLNAHPHAVISHELDAPALILGGCSREYLYSRILARARWFDLRGNRSNYAYQVPGQWQGRFSALHVIGDKRGGALTRHLAAHPDLLDRVRALVGVPLRLIHVVRNPFDTVAAISIAEGWSIEESADFYFAHCATTARLPDLCGAGELATIRHEDMVRTPAAVLGGLASFLGLERSDAWLEACSGIVFDEPTHTRKRVAWSDTLKGRVLARAREQAFLDGYGFDVPGPPSIP